MAEDTDLEDFQDFTIVTSWEGIAAAVEDCLHFWKTTGMINGSTDSPVTERLQSILEHNLPHRKGVYILTLHPKKRARQRRRQLTTTGSSGTKADERIASLGSELEAAKSSSSDEHGVDEQEGPQQPQIAKVGVSDGTAPQQQLPGLQPQIERRERRLGRLRTLAKGLREEDELEPSTATTHASIYSDADSRTASERGYFTQNGAWLGFETSDELDSQAEPNGASLHREERSHSPNPSIEDEVATASEEHASRIAMEEYAKLRTWFGVPAFVTLVPKSYSGRLMNEQEANVLRSALSVALCSSKFPLPCFIPVHDSLRDAYWGVGPAGISTVHFETDSVHISTPPARIYQVEGQIALFSQRLRPQAPRAAAQCSRSLQPWIANAKNIGPLVSMKRTYRLPQPSTEGEGSKGSDEDDGMALWADQWDSDCCWWPWASQIDPCGDIELDVEWLEMGVADATSLDSLTVAGATQWRLHVLANDQPSWSLRPALFQSFSGRPAWQRQHLRLELPSALPLQETPRESLKNGSLAAMLSSFWEGHSMASRCGTLGQLANSEWWGRQGSTFPSVPSEAVLQDVLRDLFKAVGLPGAFSGSTTPLSNKSPPELGGKKDPWGFSEGLPQCAPASSLAARLAMHALTFSNPRAVATLWIRFVRELRFAHWETLVPLPRMHCSEQAVAQHHEDSPSLPDLGCGLLHQKLQMLDVCIAEQRKVQLASHTASSKEGSARGEGVERTLQGLRLIGGDKSYMQEPVTLAPPVLTSDMVEERQAALSALGESPAGLAARSRLRGELLISDMSAFKAANPGCMLLDFVRWHSPQDWLADAEHPMGGRLSSRIGPTWEEHWQNAPPLPASRQRPLMDPQLEGERVLHWFESALLPETLWSLLMPVAVSTAASCLASCRCPGLPLIAEELTRFHSSVTTLLDTRLPLVGSFPGLLTRFQHLERLVVAAESLILRLPEAPDLVSRLLVCAVGGESAMQDTDREKGEAGRKACSSPFWEPDGEHSGALVREEGEKELVGRLMAREVHPGSSTQEEVVGGRSWAQELQEERLLEVSAGRQDAHRMYIASRQGELRVATAVVAEL